MTPKVIITLHDILPENVPKIYVKSSIEIKVIFLTKVDGQFYRLILNEFNMMSMIMDTYTAETKGTWPLLTVTGDILGHKYLPKNKYRTMTIGCLVESCRSEYMLEPMLSTTRGEAYYQYKILQMLLDNYYDDEKVILSGLSYEMIYEKFATLHQRLWGATIPLDKVQLDTEAVREKVEQKRTQKFDPTLDIAQEVFEAIRQKPQPSDSYDNENNYKV